MLGDSHLKSLLFLKRLALLIAPLFLAVVAILLHVQQLYLMAAILFLLPSVSYAIGRAMMAGLQCDRSAPSLCREDERVEVTLTLTNIGRLPKFFLRVADRLPRWVRLAGEAAPLVLQLWPGEFSQVTYGVQFEKRGVYALGPAQILSVDLFGFYAFTQTMPGTAEILVHPAVVPITQSFLLNAAAEGWRGQESARRRGSGVDFHGVREYQPGDELRRVHWRTTARTGKLAVTEYTQGMILDIVLALDLSRTAYQGMGDGPDSALEYAVKIAATLCDDLLRHGHAVRLVVPANADTAGPPTTDPAQVPILLEALARAQADSAVSLGGMLSRYVRRVSPEATLVYITPAPEQADLADAIAAWTSQNVFGFVLEAEGWRRPTRARPEPDRRPVPAGLGQVQPVRRGDDLKQVLERQDHGH